MAKVRIPEMTLFDENLIEHKPSFKTLTNPYQALTFEGAGF